MTSRGDGVADRHEEAPAPLEAKLVEDEPGRVLPTLVGDDPLDPPEPRAKLILGKPLSM